MENRFELVHGEVLTLPKNLAGNPYDNQVKSSIFKDKVTGVLYLYTQSRLGTSTMTPLLGSDGKPVIDKSE